MDGVKEDGRYITWVGFVLEGMVETLEC